MAMGIMKSILLIIAAAGGSFYFLNQQIDSTRNRLIFESPIEQVADSIKRMEYLMSKFPKTGMVNYFVDTDGYLYLNNQKIAPLMGAINNKKVTGDLVFEQFNDQQINEFFRLMAYLWRNHITSCHKESLIKMFAFSYMEKEIQNAQNYWMIVIPKKATDTVSFEFKNHFEILDKKEGLVLIN